MKFLVALAALAASPAVAQDFAVVSDRDAFVALVEGKELRLGLMGISLYVTGDGMITGTAAGWDVTGTWTWEDGHFCREMDWSGTPVPYNCQLVEASGEAQMRFTTDRGEGDSATFNLR
jgi:hypothetical protein